MLGSFEVSSTNRVVSTSERDLRLLFGHGEYTGS